MDRFRNCYVQEKRKFNSLHSEEEWLTNRKIIPEYIENQLQIIKDQKSRLSTYGDLSNTEAKQTSEFPTTVSKNKSNSMEEGYL